MVNDTKWNFMTHLCFHFIMQIIFFVAITLWNITCVFEAVLLKHMTVITFAICGLLKERPQTNFMGYLRSTSLVDRSILLKES